MAINKIDSAGALVSISLINGANCSEVVSKINRINGIESIYEVTGRHDIVAILRVPKLSDMNNPLDAIREIAGVGSVETAAILKHSLKKTKR